SLIVQGSTRSRQRGIDERQRVVALHIIHMGNAQHAAQLIRGHFHGARRRSGARCRLRERGGQRRMKCDVAFHLCMIWWICPFRTETEPKRFKYPRACSLSSVPHPQSGYTVQSGMCANTITGVLLFKSLTSSWSHLSWLAPSDPRPPALRSITLTRPMKCAPLWSKLYQPFPFVSLPKRSRYCWPLSVRTSCSPGT